MNIPCLKFKEENEVTLPIAQRLSCSTSCVSEPPQSFSTQSQFLKQTHQIPPAFCSLHHLVWRHRRDTFAKQLLP
ncbi:Phagocyte signaling-impaired [Gossypium australe]|uniref:Phagocyte signaling-impaired n=1 Tax=Gossypium australe TaxID=47621 RepID=A0A5B6X7G9_9ROSI|nr:Phagocyte signaling-impaired [Gossypium australe]